MVMLPWKDLAKFSAHVKGQQHLGLLDLLPACKLESRFTCSHHRTIVHGKFGLLGLGVFGTLDVSLRSTNSCIKLKTAVLPMLIAVFLKVNAGPLRSLAG